MLLKVLYEKTFSQVPPNSSLSNRFAVTTSTPHELVLSPLFFIRVSDWLMNGALMIDEQIGMHLDDILGADLDFANDVC